MSQIISTFIGVWIKPWATMGAVKTQGKGSSIKGAMLFVLIMGVVTGVIAAVWGFIRPIETLQGPLPRAMSLFAILLVPALTFVLSFVGAFIIWALVHGLLKGTISDYKDMYRLTALLAAFSPINQIFFPIPVVGQWIGLVINIWGLLVLINGIVIVEETPRIRTWVLLGLIFLLLFVFGFLSQRALEQEIRGGNAGLPSFGNEPTSSAPAEDLNMDELNQQLQNRADDLKTESAPPPADTKADTKTDAK